MSAGPLTLKVLILVELPLSVETTADPNAPPKSPQPTEDQEPTTRRWDPPYPRAR